MRGRTYILVVAALGCLCVAAYSQGRAGAVEWPQFRGPERTGRSTETGLLKQWPEEGPPKVWSISGLGEGYSSISVKDGRIYTMGTHDGGEAVFALDFNTGKQLWVKNSSERVFTERRGNGPRCTPTTDGKYLYTEDTFGMVICWEAEDGKQVWRISLTRDLGGGVPNWGYTESPLIVGRAVIVTPGGGRGAIAALEKKTGKVIWQSRDVRTPASYASPILVTVGESRQIINSLTRRMVGVDAETGRLLWDFTEPIARITCATPVEHEGVVFATSGYRQGSGAVRVSGQGAEQLWYDKSFGNHHGGVIRLGDHVYGFFNDLRCVEMKTGRIVWRNRSVGKGSLVYADGHFYCLSEGNTVALVEATLEGYKEKGRFRIPRSGRPSWVHPVVVGGRLFIRDQDTLTCWDVKAK